MDKKIIITIGRQNGSDGTEVAEAIGKKLGIDVYDNKLISKAAADSGFSSEIFSRNDEKKNIFKFSTFCSNILMSSLGDNCCLDENEIFRIQSEVIRDIANNNSAVIVGRCSDYILRDMPNVIDVFITAPLAYRIDKIAQVNGISSEEAENLVQRRDRDRETYYNYFTFSNWGAADNYDLCIDSTILGVDATADYIIEFARIKGLL